MSVASAVPASLDELKLEPGVIDGVAVDGPEDSGLETGWCGWKGAGGAVMSIGDSENAWSRLPWPRTLEPPGELPPVWWYAMGALVIRRPWMGSALGSGSAGKSTSESREC